MSKKYSYQLKLKVVLEYLNSGLGYQKLANKYQISQKSLIKNWVKNYELYGQEGLKPKKKHRKYSLNFKLRVLHFKQNTGASYRDTAEAFGLTNPSLIANWKKVYLVEGYEGLNKPLGRPTKMTDQNKYKKSKKIKNDKEELSEIERLKQENEYLKIEVAYLKKLSEWGLSDPREDKKP